MRNNDRTFENVLWKWGGQAPMTPFLDGAVFDQFIEGQFEDLRDGFDLEVGR